MSELGIVVSCAALLILYAAAMGFVMSRHVGKLRSRTINTNSTPRFRKV
jgi:hypothetical protein